MITVRQIIVEALDRSGLCARRMSASADLTETAFRLLKGAAAKYSNDSLLSFLVSEIDTILSANSFVIGENAEGYEAADVEATGVQKVTRCYCRADGDSEGSWAEMDFVSPEDFDAFPDGTLIYTCQAVNDLQVAFKTKLNASASQRIRIIYNRKWSFDLNTELRIPEQFEELFICAVAYKLALTYPRLSSEQTNLLKRELDEIEKNVKTSSRAVKYVARRTSRGVSRADFLSGRCFLG